MYTYIYIYVSICLFYEINLAILTKKATPIHLLYKTLLMSDLRYSGAVLIWWWRVMILCLQCYAYWYTTCMILTKAHQRLSDMLASTVSYWFRNIIPLHSMCINRLETMFLHCRFERRDLPHAFPWKLLVCDGICTWVQDLVEPLRYALTLSLCNFLGGSCEHRFKQHMNEYNV